MCLQFFFVKSEQVSALKIQSARVSNTVNTKRTNFQENWKIATFCINNWQKKSRRGFLVTTLIDSKRELMLLPCFTLILMHLHFHEIILFSIHSVMYENQKNLVKTQVCMNQNATSGKSLTHCGSGLAALGLGCIRPTMMTVKRPQQTLFPSLILYTQWGKKNLRIKFK